MGKQGVLGGGMEGWEEVMGLRGSGRGYEVAVVRGDGVEL